MYIGALLFGGLLIVASVLGAGDHPVDGFAAHAGDPHAEGSVQGLLIALFGVRFWTFGAAFFGLTGLLLHALGVAGAPVIAGVVGAGAGLGASAFFRKMTRESIGRVGDVAAFAGRDGKLLLPVGRAQQGKVRVAQPAGGSVDFVAESDDENAETLPAGMDVIIVEVRGTVAVVTRAPASRHDGT